MMGNTITDTRPVEAMAAAVTAGILSRETLIWVAVTRKRQGGVQEPAGSVALRYNHVAKGSSPEAGYAVQSAARQDGDGLDWTCLAPLAIDHTRPGALGSVARWTRLLTRIAASGTSSW